MNPWYIWIKSQLSKHPKEAIFLLGNDTTVTFGEFLELFETSIKNSKQEELKIFENFSFDTEQVLALFSCLCLGGNAVLKKNNTQIKDSDFQTSQNQIYFSTSGVTNQPSYWPHSIHSLTSALEAYCNSLEIPAGNISWTAFPASSISGFRALIVSLFTGGTLCTVEFPKGIELYKLFEICDKFQVTTLSFPPVYVEALTNMGDQMPKTARALKRIYYGGDYISHRVIERFQQIFPYKIGALFGATEVAGPICYCPANELQEGALGKLITGKILEPSPGEMGLLRVEGEFVSPKAGSKKFTFNDIVFRSHDDHLFFRGRKIDWIEYRGTKLSLIEIENFARFLAGVADAKIEVESGGSQIFKKAKILVVLSKNMSPDDSVVENELKKQYPFLDVEFVDKILKHSSGKTKRTT